jgi:hypothetical protein
MRLSRGVKEPRDRAIAVYILATLILTLISVGMTCGGFLNSHVLCSVSYSFPDLFGSAELLKKSYLGADMTDLSRIKDWPQLGALVFNPPGVEVPFPYFPSACFVLAFFLSIPYYPLGSLAICVGLSVLVAAFLLARQIGRNWLAQCALLTAIATSFPFALLIHQGQIEGILWLPSVAGVHCFIRKRYLAAAILFAITASVKPLPALMFLLFIPRQRYREFFIAIGVLIAIVFGSLWIIGPTFTTAVHEWLGGFQLWSKIYATAYRPAEMGIDHSRFALVKQVLRVLAGWPHAKVLGPKIQAVYPFYVLFCGVVFLVSIFRLRKLPTLNQLFGLSVLIILLSPANHDYTLIAMYIPWAILLFALSRADISLPFRTTCWLGILCAILFTPQCYLTFGFSGSYGAQVKAVALCGILIVSMVWPLPIARIDVPPATEHVS